MISVFLGKGESSYTYLNKVFNAIDNEQVNYNWLITNSECFPQKKSFNKLFSKKYIWISGKRLTKIIQEEDFQFIWGVFAGFPINITLEEVMEFDLPNAEYEGYWFDNVEIQHPMTEIEIVAFDSSCTILISKNDKLVQKFINYFPLSEDLVEKNKIRNLDS